MPMNIKIQPYDYMQWSPGLQLSRRAGEDYSTLLTAFSRKIADLYVKELVDAINSQRYKSRWEPLTPEYLEYKRASGLSTNIWEATSLLKESITYYKSGSSYVVGVNRNLKYPGTNVNVYKVIRFLEFGTSRMPARPLFMPVKRKLERNMSLYWIEFLQERGVLDDYRY